MKTFFLPAFCIILTILSCEGRHVKALENYPGDLRMWQHIMESASEITITGKPKGIILPHHTIVTREAAGFYQGLSRVIQPERIIILAPNHYEATGHSFITAENIIYPTVYGDVELDDAFIRRMVKAGIVKPEKNAFIKEHAVYFHAPFIRKYFPEARIVPVLHQWSIPEAEKKRLSEWLAGNDDGKTLYLASVDFSHFQRKETADFHDQAVYEVIHDFRYEDLVRMEVDSPSSLYSLMKIMDQLGNRKAERFLHTNSEALIGAKQKETTSHQYFGFFQGEAEKRKSFSIFVSGVIRDVSADLPPVFKGWRWDRSLDLSKAAGFQKYLKNIRGMEDRFLSGADLYLLDLPVQDQTEYFDFQLIRVTCKFLNSRNIKRIDGDWGRRLKKESRSDYLIAVFPSDIPVSEREKKRIFRLLADSGCDLAIGYSDEKTSYEFYHNKLLIYSLGTFIGKEVDGTALGLVIRPDHVTIFPFPLVIKDGYPQLR